MTGREFSSATVAALLTILGYSLYDAIIVFDRIREQLFGDECQAQHVVAPDTMAGAEGLDEALRPRP